jgi:hypothetical protein
MLKQKEVSRECAGSRQNREARSRHCVYGRVRITRQNKTESTPKNEHTRNNVAEERKVNRPPREEIRSPSSHSRALPAYSTTFVHDQIYCNSIDLIRSAAELHALTFVCICHYYRCTSSAPGLRAAPLSRRRVSLGARLLGMGL